MYYSIIIIIIIAINFTFPCHHSIWSQVPQHQTHQSGLLAGVCISTMLGKFQLKTHQGRWDSGVPPSFSLCHPIYTQPFSQVLHIHVPP